MNAVNDNEGLKQNNMSILQKYQDLKTVVDEYNAKLIELQNKTRSMTESRDIIDLENRINQQRNMTNKQNKEIFDKLENAANTIKDQETKISKLENTMNNQKTEMNKLRNDNQNIRHKYNKSVEEQEIF